MALIGVTGGVGAGKSRVLSYLGECYGAALILADEVGHELLAPGEANYNSAVAEFGTDILDPDGTLNRAALADRLFGSEETTRRINALFHPPVKQRIIERVTALRGEDPGRFIVIEAALLSEGGLDSLCDEVWFIYCYAETRVDRIMASRGYSRERSLSVIARQKSDEAFRQEADRVIDNSGDFAVTKEQIDKACTALGIHPQI